MARKEVEYNLITGHINQIIESLNRTIGQYKRYYKVKIGITGREPQKRYDEHLHANKRWKRMVVVYETKSHSYANKIEEWLVEQHYDEIKNVRSGGGSSLSLKGLNYVYVLLK